MNISLQDQEDSNAPKNASFGQPHNQYAKFLGASFGHSNLRQVSKCLVLCHLVVGRVFQSSAMAIWSLFSWSLACTIFYFLFFINFFCFFFWFLTNMVFVYVAHKTHNMKNLSSLRIMFFNLFIFSFPIKITCVIAQHDICMP